MELQLQSWFTVVVGLITLGIVLILRYIRRNDDYWEKRGVVYMPRMSYYTTLKTFFSKPVHEQINDGYQKYGRVFGRFEMSTPCLMVAEPDLLRDILVKDFHVFNSKREFTIEDKFFTKMVSILNGEDWKRVRSVITPAFTSRKMRKMTGIITRSAEAVLGTFNEHYDKGIPVDCRKVFGAFTMDVIASSAFATKIDSHNNPENAFVLHAKRFFTTPPVLRMLIALLIPQPLWKWIRFNPFDQAVFEFFSSVTMQVIEERRKSGQKGNDFLQLMIDASEDVLEGETKTADFKSIDQKEEEADQYGSIDCNSNITYTTKKLSQDEIVANCIMFFIVGYETSAATLSFVAYNLATNPECQDKLIREVDAAFDKHTDLTYDVLRDMKYLDGVVSETLRLYPPLYVSDRTASEDYNLGNTGITVTKGMVVSFPIHAMHHDAEFYPDPEKFDPERFIGADLLNHHPYAYLPFGAGPRNCLGMRFALLEIKLCISTILRKYRLRPCPETKVPLEFASLHGTLTTKELPLNVEQRTDLDAV